MTELNIHSPFIDKRIIVIRKSDKWKTILVNTTHEDVIKDLSSNVFTNLIRNTFTNSYIKKFNCSDCNGKATERCHGIGEERPLLLRIALEKIWNDTSQPITMKEIIIAFLEEHKYTNFTFKCHNCHRQEKKR